MTVRGGWAAAISISCFAFIFSGCGGNPEERLAAALRKGTGVVELPRGTLVLHHELAVPDGAHDLELRGNPAGSTLKAADDFKGRALIVSKGAVGLRLTGFRIEGNPRALEARVGLPPSDVPFARFYANNGVLIEGATRLTVANVSFRHVANYPLIVSASSSAHLNGLMVEDCGSLGPTGHNNASGGILLEEGTRDFEVRNCTIRRVRGNAIWTHSNYHSARNTNGAITGNRIETVARDAIQIGHATNIRVEGNTGAMIGYPTELVDIASYAVPVAIDTSGNVDKSVYAGNRFEEIDGQCIDLDGFHDGEVRENSCVSRKSYADYPYAQYGIVFGNSNPDAEPARVSIVDNVIDGAGYGGIFLIGSHHLVSGNRFLNLNRNHCTGDMRQPRCNYAAEQPDLLRSGIYLARGAARLADTAANRIIKNEINGFGMRKWCIAGGPGVSLRQNRIEGNTCSDVSSSK